MNWIDAYMFMLHQAQENNLKLKNGQPCKRREVKNILWTKPRATKCVIQSFSSLIIEKFMKTIRCIIEDAWRCLKVDNKLLNHV